MIILGDFFKPSSEIIRIGIYLQVAWESKNSWLLEKTEYPLCDFVQLQPRVLVMVSEL